MAHSEARFLAGTSGIAELTNAISNAIEGESADCSTADVKAADCNVVAENSDISLPLGGLASLSLGAVDNYAGAQGTGASRASSGVIGDNGFIDTDYDGPDGSVTVGLSNGSLTGPIGDALADVTARIGAVSGQADADKNAVTTDYNIAGATVEADLKILETINTQLESALSGYNLLGTLSGTNEITLSELSELFPDRARSAARRTGRAHLADRRPDDHVPEHQRPDLCAGRLLGWRRHD
ncbi:choice-of-anchor G family protein [Aeromicrobium sp. UC242_57]|uniref:choice-of-anchor G family protein n=1 Tax=Aeromicrobium sp. UC242_57 TaxID=3374624 RepID=UPI0037979CC8